MGCGGGGIGCGYSIGTAVKLLHYTVNYIRYRDIVRKREFENSKRNLQVFDVKSLVYVKVLKKKKFYSSHSREGGGRYF